MMGWRHKTTTHQLENLVKLTERREGFEFSALEWRESSATLPFLITFEFQFNERLEKKRNSKDDC